MPKDNDALESEKPDKKDLETEYKIYSKKMDSSLLPLLNEKFLPPGQSIEDHRNTMQSLGHFLPTGSPVPRKELSAPADIVYLEISLAENYPPESVEQYAWLIVNQSDKHGLVIAWVRVDGLKELAEQEAVQMIRPVMPPELR